MQSFDLSDEYAIIIERRAWGLPEREETQMAHTSQSITIELEIGDERERTVDIDLHSEDDGFDHEHGYQEQVDWYIDEIRDSETGETIDIDTVSNTDQERAREKAFEQA